MLEVKTMNDRVNALKQQATTWAKDMATKEPHLCSVGSDYFWALVHERFAELIVNECVDVGCKAFVNDNRPVPTFPDKHIRQHFGLGV